MGDTTAVGPLDRRGVRGRNSIVGGSAMRQKPLIARDNPPPPTRAITICQPHAWAVVQGLKRFENRTWPTRHRGRLLIHAGMSRQYLHSGGYPGEPDEKDLVFGALIGEVNVVESLTPKDIERRDGKLHGYAEGPCCHEYDRPIAYKYPIPCKGALYLWPVPEDILDRATEERNAVVLAAMKGIER